MAVDLASSIALIACGLLLLSAVIVLGLTRSWTSKNEFHRLPYLPSVIPVLGNALELARNLGRYHPWLADHSVKRDGQPFALHLLGKNDVLYLSRPEHFEEVVKTQSCNFSKSASVREMFDDFLGESIVLTNGESWHFHRKTFATLITMRALREYMTPTIQEKTLLLQQILDKASQTKQTFDAQKLIRQFTLDTFVEIGFGCQLNLLTSGNDHPFEIAFDDANRLSSERFTKPTWIWKPQRWLNVGNERRLREAINEMDQFMMGLILNAIDRAKQVKTENAEGQTRHNNIMSTRTETSHPHRLEILP